MTTEIPNNDRRPPGSLDEVSQMDNGPGVVIPLPCNASDNGIEDRAVRGVVDTAYEVELDEEPSPATPPVPVDTTPVVPVQAAEATRRPIIPPQLRPGNIKATVTRAAGRAAHVGGFHAVRSPWYALKLGYYALCGLLRVLGGQIRWWWVPGSFEMLQHAASSNQLVEWERVHRQIRSTRLWRGIVLGAEALALGIGVPVLLEVPQAQL
jgi:DNA segregation ATPase FtsK/SpoIIIE, S-DNA-T family